MNNKYKKAIPIILCVSIISTVLYNIIGIGISLITNYKAFNYSEIIQCLVWVATVLVSLIIVGGITLFILFIRKNRELLNAIIKHKIIYIAVTFGLTYTFSVIVVTIFKGYFDTTYMTTYITTLGVIGAISALVAIIKKYTTEKVETVNRKDEIQSNQEGKTKQVSGQSNIKKCKNKKHKKKK